MPGPAGKGAFLDGSERSSLLGLQPDARTLRAVTNKKLASPKIPPEKQSPKTKPNSQVSFKMAIHLVGISADRYEIRLQKALGTVLQELPEKEFPPDRGTVEDSFPPK